MKNTLFLLIAMSSRPGRMRYHARETATVIETSQVSDDRDGSQKCHVMFYNGPKENVPAEAPSGNDRELPRRFGERRL